MASYEAISMPSSNPITSGIRPSSAHEYCYVTETSLQPEASQPPIAGADVGTLDSAGYLRPQPSVEYVASHEAISMPSSNPVTAGIKPSSSEYCYVTQAYLQPQVPQPPVAVADVEALYSDGYVVLH